MAAPCNGHASVNPKQQTPLLETPPNTNRLPCFGTSISHIPFLQGSGFEMYSFVCFCFCLCCCFLALEVLAWDLRLWRPIS